MNPAFWRKWHRWIAFPAAAFLLFAAITGVVVAMTEFFGDEEALREATRDLVSSVKTHSPGASWAFGDGGLVSAMMRVLVGLSAECERRLRPLSLSLSVR